MTSAKRFRVLAVSLASVGVLSWIGSPPVEPQRRDPSVQAVLVTNFPEPQQVRGVVGIEGPIRLAELVRFEEILVPPIPPSETTRLVDAGTLHADGFPAVVLSLHGQTKGDVTRPGSVGAILLPEQDSITAAFREHGLVHFAMEVVSDEVSVATPYFASDQPRYTVGFPSYRVFLYNTTDKSITASLFAYLTE